MTKYIQTVLTIAVHPKGVNPVFGEGVTHVSLNDEAGGYFVELRQSDETAENGIVRIDPNEWEEIKVAVQTLLNNAPAVDDTMLA